MDEKKRAACRAVRTIVTGSLLATLAAASFGCDRDEQGIYASRPSVDGQARQPGQMQGETPVAPLPPPGVTGGLDAAAPIRDYVGIVGATDRTTLLNRPVDLTNVEVVKVGSPKTFWIGGSRDQGVPVFVEDTLARGSVKGSEVQEGQRLYLLGELRPVPPAQQMQADWAVSPEDANALSQGMIYVHARYVSFGPIAEDKRSQASEAGQAGHAGAQGQAAVVQQGDQVPEGSPRQVAGSPDRPGSAQGQAGRQGQKGLEGQQGAQQRVDPSPNNPSRAYTAPNAEPRGR
ncbi:hypothetical protein [Polyangium aurulentum]|uniref:hypothetical protein n=1 Tax=Polyangium aurulentum TaxID=2567896 RepID=UPI0010ADEE0D|nr:hypothetical protein [Polyangium aurulentum]UQA58405.1 hypothetical protein E8A73_045370 [Polyangium aurulentum]